MTKFLGAFCGAVCGITLLGVVLTLSSEGMANRISPRRLQPDAQDLVAGGSVEVTSSGDGECDAADEVVYDNNGVIGCEKTSDTAPQGLMLRPQPAFESGTQSAANLILCGGQDETQIAIDGADPSVTCADDDDTVTVTVINSNGSSTATVLTEGTEWTASSSVADTCTSLASAVDALSGVSASCTSPDVLVVLDEDTCSVTLAESTAGCTTVTTGTQGVILADATIDLNDKRLILDADGDWYIESGGFDDTTIFGLSGSAKFVMTNTAFYGNNANAPAMWNAAVSDTVVGVEGNRSGSAKYGLGGSSTYASLIGNNIEQMRIAATGVGFGTGSETLGAAATEITPTRSIWTVTGDAGANTVATIAGGFGGNILLLHFVDALVTITDTDAHTADTVDLNSAFTSADDVSLLLWFDGTSWYEISRSNGVASAVDDTGYSSTAINIETADSGGTAAAAGDELVLENTAATGLSILCSTSSCTDSIFFGDDEDPDATYLKARHSPQDVVVFVETVQVMEWDADMVQMKVAMRHKQVEGTAPAEPFACSNSYVGTQVYVDDTNDAASAVMCICVDTDDGSTFDWVRADDNATACPFF